MNNCIVINGARIELTEEQIDQIITAHSRSSVAAIQLSEVAAGDTFKIGEHEFIVLAQSGDTTEVIRKNLLPGQRFGSSNNFGDSEAGKTCSDFAEEIAEIIGAENIIAHMVELTSDDGLRDYGIIRSRCSLLTADMYRYYVEILDKFKPDDWWWLATPFSTKRHDNNSWVKCVSPAGCINYNRCSCGSSGVRPFCILKSTIFVSK